MTLADRGPDALANTKRGPILAPVTATKPALRDWLAQEPFTLAMSAGFFGFFAHSGMLGALEEAGLLPAAVSGASAGALVGGLWASGLDAAALTEELCQLRREDFWDPGVGLGLLRGKRFRARLEALLPVREFSNCRVPAALSVYDVLTRTTRVLRSGQLAPAIQASCTLPGLFQPTWHDGRPLLDGGILDRPGIEGVTSGTRVLHHHLSSRSPWRRKESAALAPPRRPELVAVVLDGLPRSGPFRLGEGVRALDAARRSMRRALERPVNDGVVRIAVDS
jgi:NTE family protein